MKVAKTPPLYRLNHVMTELLPELEDIMRNELENSIKINDVVASENLYNSIKTKIAPEALELQKEVVGELNFYGRFQDLKYLEYYSQWNAPDNRGKRYKTTNKDADTPAIVLAFEDYIKSEGGMSYLKYTPGRFTNVTYKKKLTDAAKIRRAAWSFAASRLQKPRIKNKRKKYWYTEALRVIRAKCAARVRDLMAREIASIIKDEIESE